MQGGPDSKTPEDLYGCAVRRLDGPALDVAPCPICRGTRSRPRYAVEGVAEAVVVCEDCGLGRFHPMLDASRIAAFYPDEYYGEPGVKFQPLVERAVRWIGSRHVEFLSRGLPPAARVLDVGCGRGVVLGALADRGFEVHGVEVSAAAARGSDPRAEVRVAPSLADAGYPDGHFDQVLIWHVLEHLGDPRATLDEVHRILRPGGRLVVAVPNFESAQARWSDAAWFHLDLPRHLYQFPLSALRRLLVDTGFDPQSDHHFSLRQNPFGWMQSAMNRWSALPRNGSYAMLQRRGDASPPPFSAAMRATLWVAMLLTAPFALAATCWEALHASGATVHVVATRRPAPEDPARA